MSDYHTKIPYSGETTEWEDLQVKFGNWNPRKKPAPPPKWKPSDEEDKDDAQGDMDDKELDELEDLEDEFEDDRFLEEYRQMRIAEMKEASIARSRAPGFGEIQFIRRNEFVSQVTEASNGTWVVVFLYKDSHVGCELLSRCLAELCSTYTRTKFVKIVSTDCVANFPDKHLPTLVVYKDGKVAETINGAAAYGGKHMTTESVAYELNKLGPICVREGETEEDANKGVVKAAIAKIISRQEGRDSDSDIDD